MGHKGNPCHPCNRSILLYLLKAIPIRTYLLIVYVHNHHNHHSGQPQVGPSSMGAPVAAVGGYICPILKTSTSFLRYPVMVILLIKTHLEPVSVDFLDLHLPPVSGTGLVMILGDLWAIPDDNDILTLEPVEKLTDREGQFSESTHDARRLLPITKDKYKCCKLHYPVLFVMEVMYANLNRNM